MFHNTAAAWKKGKKEAVRKSEKKNRHKMPKTAVEIHYSCMAKKMLFDSRNNLMGDGDGNVLGRKKKTG